MVWKWAAVRNLNQCESETQCAGEHMRGTSSHCSDESTALLKNRLNRGIPYSCPWYCKPTSMLMCAFVSVKVKDSFIGGSVLFKDKFCCFISATLNETFNPRLLQMDCPWLLHAVFYAVCYLQLFKNSM